MKSAQAPHVLCSHVPEATGVMAVPMILVLHAILPLSWRKFTKSDKIRQEFVALLGKARSTNEGLKIQECIRENKIVRRCKVAEMQKTNWSGFVIGESKV